MFCNGYGGFGPASSIGYGGMFLGMGFRMLVFIVLIFFAVKLFKSYSNKSNSAMRILNEKFANGEMTQEEYLKRKEILSQKN
ncbi:SHOCT domain-containing protein [uncultured Clostridium sp.]|uniref:SHOCT domain-containing protein n=1 Tax=uncultured Clostridium sp. TaxID=59620 RepID=UPI0028E5A041|nr:SHOCT domain-containing protein [uncultured Clostridium sp.]